MKCIIFILWIFVSVQLRRSDLISTREPISAMSVEETTRIDKHKRNASMPGVYQKTTKGWLWCADKRKNSTFAFKPCPGDPHLEECLKLTNVARTEAKKLLQGILAKSGKPMKKFLLCYLSKNGVMSPDAVLRQDVVLKNIPDRDKDKVEKTINKCLFKTAHDPIETAWHYIACFLSRQPKYAKIANRLK